MTMTLSNQILASRSVRLDGPHGFAGEPAPKPPHRVSLAEALRGFEWEAEHGEVELARYRCRYAAWGDPASPPLIFVHGWCDSHQSSVLPMALLHEHFRCIAYSQPTGGRDRARLSNYHHEHLVDDLFALMDHLGYRRASVAAHSYGSTIAIRAMHDRPTHIDRGVLIAGFARRALVRGERWMAQLGRYLPGPMNLLPWRSEALKRSHLRPFRQYDPDTFQYFFDTTGWIPIRAASHWALRLNETDVGPLLPRVRQPVLIVAGEKDPLIPPRCQAQLFRELSNSVMFVIDGCGHYPMFTHPAVLADAIVRFCDAPPCVFANSPAGAVSACTTAAMANCIGVASAPHRSACS